jgi:hypothetical protein
MDGDSTNASDMMVRNSQADLRQQVSHHPQ